MLRFVQKPLFVLPDEKRTSRSGSFVDNMSLPVHRWLRYSAGFSAEWVEQVIRAQEPSPEFVILDPFAGSGTTQLVADQLGLKSYGVEAHPFVVKITRAKLHWHSSTDSLARFASQIYDHARTIQNQKLEYPLLIQRCFSPDVLAHLDSLKRSWELLNDAGPASELTWLAITSILRSASHAGTAQWQYILPNKSKKVITQPYDAFQMQIEMMQADMFEYQRLRPSSGAVFIPGDARECQGVPEDSVDMVITSPPYANNYDYADATRFEMSFWGDVQSWTDLHDTVRRHLIVSSSQHASAEKLDLDAVLADKNLLPIEHELTVACRSLEKERLTHGGKKHYHTMVAAYFADMSRVWHALSRVCKRDALACFVIGDSAPYGIHIPVERWLGELAIAAGFSEYHFEMVRARNTKWKNRKHRVPLHEGRLWVSK